MFPGSTGVNVAITLRRDELAHKTLLLLRLDRSQSSDGQQQLSGHSLYCSYLGNALLITAERDGNICAVLRFDRASPRRTDTEFRAVVRQLLAKSISNDAAKPGPIERRENGEIS